MQRSQRVTQCWVCGVRFDTALHCTDALYGAMQDARTKTHAFFEEPCCQEGLYWPCSLALGDNAFDTLRHCGTHMNGVHIHASLRKLEIGIAYAYEPEAKKDPMTMGAS